MICDLIELPYDDRIVTRLIDLNFDFGLGEVVKVIEYLPAEDNSRYGHFITDRDKKYRWRTNGHTLMALKHSRTLR